METDLLLVSEREKAQSKQVAHTTSGSFCSKPAPRNMERRVWFQLVGPKRVMATSVSFANMAPQRATVHRLQMAVKADFCDSLLARVDDLELEVYANNAAFAERYRTPLDIDDSLQRLGTSEQDPVIIEIPPSTGNRGQSSTRVIVVALPHTAPLANADAFLEECGSLLEWRAGSIHEIPLICGMMRRLGGCSATNKMLWRQEEVDVASILLEGWLRVPTEDAPNQFWSLRSILHGSPGVGKSLLLCVLAFYVALRHKKSVVVYRRWRETNQEHYDCHSLLFLHYDTSRDQVVHFAMHDCDTVRAAALYKELTRQHGIENVRLLLDGFGYDKIPDGLHTFTLLVTSQCVSISSRASTCTYVILHPNWKKKDLVALAQQIYGWDHATADERFFFSGGNLSEFTRPSVDEIAATVEDAVKAVGPHTALLFTPVLYKLDYLGRRGARISGLRRTFVDPNCSWPMVHQYRTSWERVVDSEYALLLLANRLGVRQVETMRRWVVRGDALMYAPLAESLFQIAVYRLAVNNALRIRMAPLAQLASGCLQRDRYFHFGMQLDVRHGTTTRSGTTAAEAEATLCAWRDDDASTYWFPACYDFPMVDCIIKRKHLPRASDAGSANVAYFQFQMAAKGEFRAMLDATRLAVIHAIVSRESTVNTATTTEMDKPLFVLLYPSCEALVEVDWTSLPDDLADVQALCRVYVGYYEDDKPGRREDGTGEAIQEIVARPAARQCYEQRQRAHAKWAGSTSENTAM